MKYVKQFGIIIVISFIGEVLNHLMPLPIPASIYGLLLMFICLYTKLIKIEDVKETAMFLIEIMPMMFIPATVGLITSWEVLKPNLVEYTVITVVSTFLVMAAAGRATQIFLRCKKKNDIKEEGKS